jgi:5'-nucleotidase
MRILVTNDDGVGSTGLHALADALDAIGEVVVVAPATDQTAVARGITISETIAVDEVELPGGRPAFAVAGTPTDCVRFAVMGIAGDVPDVVASGINRGANLGDDISYSGTVAAAFEGLLSGLPSLAFSQQARDGRDWSRNAEYDYAVMCAVAPRLVSSAVEQGLPSGTLLTVNAPGLAREEVRGVRVTRLGRRVYGGRLDLAAEEGARRHYRIYGERPGYHDEDGTDVSAIARGYVTVTPLHYDLTDRAAAETLRGWGVEDLALG